MELLLAIEATWNEIPTYNLFAGLDRNYKPAKLTIGEFEQFDHTQYALWFASSVEAKRIASEKLTDSCITECLRQKVLGEYLIQAPQSCTTCENTNPKKNTF